MNKGLWTALAMGCAGMALTSCGGAETEAPADPNPDAPAGISISDARMNLPAVGGNPAAVYFSVTNDSDQNKTIRSVYVAGAESAMMHQTAEWSGKMDMQEVFQLSVPAGETLKLEQGGLHVMAMGVSPDLKPGGETEVTVTFVGGDKASFPAKLLAPGESGDAADAGEAN